MRGSRFMFVKNVSLRCEVGGGVQYLVSGEADELTSEGVREKKAFVIRVSPRGRVEITE